MPEIETPTNQEVRTLSLPPLEKPTECDYCTRKAQDDLLFIEAVAVKVHGQDFAVRLCKDCRENPRTILHVQWILLDTSIMAGTRQIKVLKASIEQTTKIIEQMLSKTRVFKREKLDIELRFRKDYSDFKYDRVDYQVMKKQAVDEEVNSEKWQ